MRRENAMGFAIGAALTMAPLPAFAQTDPAQLFRPKPAPDSAAASVPATPKTMGVTPEQFALMGVDKDARVPNRPSRRSDGYIQYEPPLAIPGPALRPVALVPGAVIASGAVRIDERRWRSTAPIAIGAPFNVTVPADARFGASLDENGLSRPCLTRAPYVTYEPAEDEKGEIYPSICLGERDAAGRYISVRLAPHYTDGTRPRDIAIAPVAIDPLASGSADPRFRALIAVRRLRVDAVTGDSVTVALEMASDKRAEAGGPSDPLAVLKDFRVMSTVCMPLSDGATAPLAGIILALRRTPSGWTLEPAGSLTTWAGVSSDGTKVTLGEYSIGPHIR